MKNLNKKYFIFSNATIKTALSYLNVSPHKCLMVTNVKKKLLGTITDGDIRKSILKDPNLERSIKNIYNPDPIKVYENEVDKNEIKKILQINKFELIPVINKKNSIVDIFSWDQFFTLNDDTYSHNIDMIIMAGGRGKRLAPFTNTYPKALMPIGGIPMIIRILDKYYMQGFNNFYISAFYQKKILKDVLKKKFEDLNNSKLTFINETKPLGTIGAIRNIDVKKLSENIIITNCDTIISENIYKIVEKHIKNNSDITLLVTNKKLEFPYGQIKTKNKSEFIEIIEKPIFDFVINVGFYIIKKDIIKLIPKNKFFDATDLIMRAKKMKKKIHTHHISNNNWVEIGKTSELDTFNKIIKLD